MQKGKVIVLKHHPMNLKFINPWYTQQVDGDLSEYEVVDVTSRVTRNKEFMAKHPGFNRDMSPFYMGPVHTSEGLTAHVFEHFWQVSKVFPCHYDKDTDTIKPEYFSWRKKWFDMEKVIDKTASRRPHSQLGYSDGDCLFSVRYVNGTWERMGYVEARKKMYIPEYAKLVVKTKSFKWLKKMYDEGKKIALVDFDGYNFDYNVAKEKLYNTYINKCKKNHAEPVHTLEDFLNLRTMQDVINCGFTPAGHGFIIKMLLDGDLEVKGDQVIDHIGVLNYENGGEVIKPLPFTREGHNNEINY